MLLLPVVYRPFPTSNHNLMVMLISVSTVVYRPFPTSNHNLSQPIGFQLIVVYRPFPTSNHNGKCDQCRDTRLYIVRFLHQTTTAPNSQLFENRCISSVSYIKPQLLVMYYFLLSVVYRPFPTSNHNSKPLQAIASHVVYRPFPTSNHNQRIHRFHGYFVVYRPFPTSNHNLSP